MAFELLYDNQNNIVHLSVIGEYTADDAREFNNRTKEYLIGQDYRQLLVNLSKADVMAGTVARKTQAEGLRELNITHMAMIHAKPFVRMMGKVLVKLTNSSVESRFFNSEDEAFQWLIKARIDNE